MLIPFILGAALAAQSPAPAFPVEQFHLSEEAQSALRCSAAFALVSYGQERGDPAAAKWPDLDSRGREFFVRVMAQLIDETGRDPDQVAELARAEAQRLLDANEVEKVMPVCLTMLETSGL